MRKTRLAFLCVVMTLLLCLVSCMDLGDYFDSGKKPIGSGDPIDSGDDTGSDDTTKDFYILGFEDVGSGSRGMTGFPPSVPFSSFDVGSANPYDQFWFSCNAMSALPIIPSLRKVAENPVSYAASVLNNDYSGYGFPMKLVKCVPNLDGIFFRYELYEDTKTIGMIDYYYSWTTMTFSYREIVTPFLDRANPGFGDNILFFQMYDVPVTEDLSGIHFSAGVSNGSLDTDTIISLKKIGLNNVGLQIREFEMLMKYDETEVSATGYRTLRNSTDGGIIENISGFDSFLTNSENVDKYHYTYNSGTKVITVDDTYCNLDFAFDFMSFLFGEEDVTALKNANNIRSLSDFNDLRLEFVSGVTSRLDLEISDLSLCTKYDFKVNSGIGATLGPFGNEYLSHVGGLDAAIVGFTSNFSDGYSSITKSRDFAIAQLKQCGLTEANATALISGYSWTDD